MAKYEETFDKQNGLTKWDESGGRSPTDRHSQKDGHLLYGARRPSPSISVRHDMDKSSWWDGKSSSDKY